MAMAAGIKSGDVIVVINDVKVDNVAELQEIVARNRPGDAVEVVYLRNGIEKKVRATLKNNEGNTELVKREETALIEGAAFENLSKAEYRNMKLMEA